MKGIKLVVQYDLPKDLNTLTQCFGCGARDPSLDAIAILLAPSNSYDKELKGKKRKCADMVRENTSPPPPLKHHSVSLPPVTHEEAMEMENPTNAHADNSMELGTDIEGINNAGNEAMVADDDDENEVLVMHAAP